MRCAWAFVGRRQIAATPRRSLRSQATGDDWFSPAQRAALPTVDASQWARLEAAARHLFDWNAKVNVVSRKDLTGASSKKVDVVASCADVAGCATSRFAGALGHRRGPRPVLGRSVKNLPDFFRTVAPALSPVAPARDASGVLYIKGGDIADGLDELGGAVAPAATWAIEELLGGVVATDKRVLYFEKADVLGAAR
ncbi:hypothetical protein JL721_11664 [Aureococcus anophagefferens]|nr:hypothetical protein JL721_11664 [Aureococcus anophagefferens]